MSDPSEFKGRIIFMSMFKDISWGSQVNAQECELNANLVSFFARRFSSGRWSFLGPGSEKKWYSSHDSKPQREWDRVAELMMIKFSESRHQVFRATSPLSRGIKSKGGGQLSIHFCADGETIETVGAVAEMCEECDSCHDRTGRPVVAGQSNPLFVPSVMKTNVPLNSDYHAHKDLLLQRYGERIEKLSQRLSKFCMDAGFLTVEIGQYFMTKDTAEFSQFHAVACREYTLPRDESLTEPKGWFRGNTKIGPVLEVTTCCL